MDKQITIGDKVTFDTAQVEIFKHETSGDSREIRQYQELVLAGVNQVGIVKGFNGNLTNVSYPDGWKLPVPTKYLFVLQ